MINSLDTITVILLLQTCTVRYIWINFVIFQYSFKMQKCFFSRASASFQNTDTFISIPCSFVKIDHVLNNHKVQIYNNLKMQTLYLFSLYTIQ